jgi:(4S)-4-hydroxy-5-phosphonooxypentane-2,3-dione isomerase
MAQFGLVVDFEIRPDAIDRFMPLINENARRSVADEPGCRQFDVLRVKDQPNRVMLYEIYDDDAAFAAHIKMPHVAAFFAAAKELIVKQTAYRLERALAVAKP